MIDGVAADWASEFNLSFPILDDNSRSLWSLFDGYYIPLNLVIDRNMIIRFRDSGFDHHEVETIVQGIISNP